MMMLLVELLVLCSCSRADLVEGAQPEALVQACLINTSAAADD